jgi:hypothetical protein
MNNNTAVGIYEFSWAQEMARVIANVLVFLSMVTVGLFNDFCKFKDAIIDCYYIYMDSEELEDPESQSFIGRFWELVFYYLKLDDDQAQVVQAAGTIWFYVVVLFIWTWVTKKFLTYPFRVLWWLITASRPVMVSALPANLRLMKVNGQTKVIDTTSSKEIGVIKEMAVTPHKATPCNKIKFLVNFYSDTYQLVGRGWRSGQYVYSALHVVSNSTYVANPYNVKTFIKISRGELEVDVHNDSARIKFDEAMFAALAIKSATVCRAKTAARITIPYVVTDGLKPVTYTSSGQIEAGRSDEHHKYGLLHTANTFPGLSGSPILLGSRVVGMHVAADPKLKLNIGVDLYNVIIQHDDETISSVESDIYPREPRFSNRKFADSYDEPKFKGKAWADYSDSEDEGSDTDYLNESEDFQPSPTQARAGAVKSCQASLECTSTTTTASVINTSKPSNLKELRQRRALTVTKSLSDSGQSSLVGTPTAETPHSSRLLTKSLSDSRKLETSPILQSSTIMDESSNPSVSPVDRKPHPAQAEKGAKKQMKRRRRRRRNRNSSKTPNTSSQTSTVNLGASLSNEQLEMLFRKFLENRLQGASSAPSEQPTSKC